MQLAFYFAFFLHFRLCPKVEIFLHLDATSAKEKVGHRVGSCIFEKVPEAFFLKCNYLFFLQGIFLEVALFALFCIFLQFFFAFFAIHFF
jgi:hypothetical protein